VRRSGSIDSIITVDTDVWRVPRHDVTTERRSGRRRPRRPVAEAAGVEPPRDLDELRRRFSTWWWPATQMAMAAGLAWLLANTLLESPAGYAPITAVVAMGLGRERRIWRSVVLIGGLLLGTVVAEIAGHALGVGWWQVGIVLGASGLLAGLLFDRDLAVTYATINAVVLYGIPGSHGWLPTRVIDGLLGVAAALVVTFGVAPSRPHRQLAGRLRTVAGQAADGLELAAEALRSDLDERRPDAVRAASARIDRELQRVPGTVEHALDLARWAPIRRLDADAVERLVVSSSALVDALTTASTVVRLTDRALVNDATVGDRLLDGVGLTASAIRTLVDDIVTERRPDDGVGEECREAIDALMSEPEDRAVVIAIQEEVRGLLDDLIDIADDLSMDGSAPFAESVSTRGATIDGVRFGRAARR
jgi:uncharacterized membrane protein YgaE (UPF0421/DUF939 family)